jgi:hypothetical protein
MHGVYGGGGIGMGHIYTIQKLIPTLNYTGVMHIYAQYRSFFGSLFVIFPLLAGISEITHPRIFHGWTNVIDSRFSNSSRYYSADDVRLL